MLTNDMAEFLWVVPTAGHEWGDFKPGQFFKRDIRSQSIRVLTDRVAIGEGFAARQYLPLVQHTGLFRTFSLDTDWSEEGIRAFADKYGPLGLYADIILPTNTLGRGETRDSWASEIAEMRRAVQMWDRARHGEVKALAKTIGWVGKDRVCYQEKTGGRVTRAEEIASTVYRPDVLARLKPGDYIGPAMWWTQRVINKKLDEHSVVARLLWDAQDSAGKQLTVRFVPKNLIGCMWLQLAKAVEGKDYRQCANCKTWFEVGGTRSARADKKFCTPTCKAALHRRENEQKKARTQK